MNLTNHGSRFLITLTDYEYKTSGLYTYHSWLKFIFDSNEWGRWKIVNQNMYLNNVLLCQCDFNNSRRKGRKMWMTVVGITFFIFSCLSEFRLIGGCSMKRQTMMEKIATLVTCSKQVRYRQLYKSNLQLEHRQINRWWNNRWHIQHWWWRNMTRLNSLDKL